MAVRLLNFVAIWSVILTIQFSSATALISSPDLNPPHPKAFSDLKEAILKGLGFQAEDFKISGFDLRDALVGRSVAYEFDVEIDNKVLPFKLLEDVNRWEYVDLPIFRVEDSPKSGEKNGLVKPENKDNGLPVLAPFQLAGPMEIWIQDAKDMRISLPHDVDAGVLKKVILAEGAVVTVKGARSVSLRHPVEFPIPLNRTQTNFASALLTLAHQLHHASRGQKAPILSLRIVGPTSLTSPTSPSKLKLKRLAPGLVELFRPIPIVNLQEPISAVDLLTPTRFTTLWPVTSVNGSHPNLRGFESLLASVLGPKADEKGSFKLVKADVAAQTFVKIGFGVEKKLKEKLVGFPDWRTKPENVRMHFEVLAKIDGDKVVPERVVQVNPVEVEDSVVPNVLNGNITMSRVPVYYAPQNPMTL